MDDDVGSLHFRKPPTGGFTRQNGGSTNVTMNKKWFNGHTCLTSPAKQCGIERNFTTEKMAMPDQQKDGHGRKVRTTGGFGRYE